MKLMRFIVWAAVVVLLAFLSIQLYHLYLNNRDVGKELQKTTAEVQALAKENEQLQEDIKYFSEPENLAKELKAKFDYKKPGEKLIKIQ